MPRSNVTLPELMRIAANSAQVCMDDPNCTVDFLSDGVEPTGDGRYTVNLAGAVLVKIFGQERNKHLEPRENLRGKRFCMKSALEIFSKALEHAFGKDGNVAPDDVISEITSKYELIDRQSDNSDRKIMWTKQAASVLEAITGWKCADETLEFKDYQTRMRARLSVSQRPFFKICQEITEIVDIDRGLVMETEWGDVDFVDVREAILRVRRLSNQLVEVTDADISSTEVERTRDALQEVLDILNQMREWDLTREDAASERTRLMESLKETEAGLRDIVNDWLPLWTTIEAEKKRAAAEKTEQRARQAQAEATGEATNTIRDAYNDEVKLDGFSKYRWTVLVFGCIVGIVFVNILIGK